MRAGRLNLAPYSFFNAFNYIPPIVGFASIGAQGQPAQHREHTGEFGWNLATRALAEPMNQSCAAVPPEVDEFALAGLTPVASQRHPGAARGREPGLVRMQAHARSCSCKPRTAPGADLAGPWRGGGGAHRQDLLKEGIYDTAAARPILRGGGPADYFEVQPEALFRMWRPKV